MLDSIYLACFADKKKNMKIFEISKPLNPEADEYRPIPHSPPLFPLTVIQPPPPPPLFCLHFSQPLYTIFLPAATPNSDKETEVGEGAKCPILPSNDVVCKRGQKKFLPPRLRRVSRSSDAAKKPPPQPKQVWRCKKSEDATVSDIPVPSKQQWRLKNDSNTSAPPPPHSSPTTVMIKNIPNQIR